MSQIVKIKLFPLPRYSQSTLPPPPQALPPHPQPQPVQSNHGSSTVHHHHSTNGGGGGFQQMARMMDSLILDNFGPFAFTKITTSHHHHHRLPSRTSALKKNGVGSSTHLPQTGHSTHSTPSPSSSTRMHLHRNSINGGGGITKTSYSHHGELI